ncbi:LysR family transcriptional regulator [Oceanospirillum linum]|uniref:LysR family transcriptional regulator n=1 Tax=Oceanospirillum linum TaxID=966 RepID=A0A1T1H9Q8_OCELI|nr:LysR family transcriptional regulator [Oceanospirillum linum]OOV86460.1 LysR family transcriptional regulator [Oceanospirillum linum]SEG34075.1 DNA-binding transcriptional regulator, LysR family [Oleiphilus messinensis]SMP29435.1 DNA-binding transcriptional regulator, LysR family [Oceanospirillum linum]
MLNWQDIQIFLEVARANRLTDAARRLNIDHSTVSRRIRRFETQLNTQLFERSTHGYRLTGAGEQLLLFAEEMARQVTGANEHISDQNLKISGQIRIGVTEGFGTYVITPLLNAFQERYPELTIELLALPRAVSLGRHEADLAITIDRPRNAEMIVSRLCNYKLQLYGEQEYLERRGRPDTIKSLSTFDLIGYVDDLVFSDQLCYLDPMLQELKTTPHFTLRSTSLITQMHAVLAGSGLSVLPCFMAAQEPRLEPLLKEEINIYREFWIAARPEQRQLLRVRLLWQFLKQAIELNQAWLMGEDSTDLPHRLRLPPIDP